MGAVLRWLQTPSTYSTPSTLNASQSWDTTGEARVAYTLAAIVPQRITAITALALAYQPRGVFTMPSFEQARAFWYQWLMYVDAGAHAVAADPIAFARLQWDTWSPPGWFNETARSFSNPDWVAITLNAYRFRFLGHEPRDPRYEPLTRRLQEVEYIATPTLMILGGEDRCDEPSGSTDQDRFVTDGYRRILLEGVGHFPHREAPDEIARIIDRHLQVALQH
jgi:pimeloyl-ACP methyl ester carboxylesterase